MLSGWNAKYTLVALAMVLVFALVVVLALNGDDDTPEVTPTPTPTSTTSTVSATPTPEEDEFVVAPGRVGAARIGMTTSEAAATGLFDVDVDHGSDDCRGVSALEWKKSVSTALDVFVNDDRIVSIGIGADGPKTAQGVGVGSTLAQVRAAFVDLTPIEEAGFDQSGNYVVVGDQYLGFLYNENAFDTNDSSKVTFMEVTKGAKPLLIRDGC